MPTKIGEHVKQLAQRHEPAAEQQRGKIREERLRGHGYWA